MIIITKEQAEKLVLEELSKFIDSEILDSFKGSLPTTLNLRNDLNIDSLEEIEIVMNLEKQMDLPILDADAEKVQTVGDLIELFASKF
jgi:acyl carrier protein